MSEINNKLKNMRETLNQKFEKFYRLSKERRMNEAETALLEAVEYNNSILQVVKEEIQKISNESSVINEKLENKDPKKLSDSLPPQNQSPKKFIIIPKQQYIH